MGELYNKMARDLALKNLAATTQKEYLRCCCHFIWYHMTSPRELGETAIKQYLEHLQFKGTGPETLKMNVAALRFLYGVTLDRPKVAERLPWPKGKGTACLVRASGRRDTCRRTFSTSFFGPGLLLGQRPHKPG
ncbi:MAG: site-specific integrase [Myxococcota bacterium]